MFFTEIFNNSFSKKKMFCYHKYIKQKVFKNIDHCLILITVPFWVFLWCIQYINMGICMCAISENTHNRIKLNEK
jgi:hypothetical protein